VLITLQEENSEESLVQCVHCPNALCISANQAADQVDQLINLLTLSNPLLVSQRAFGQPPPPFNTQNYH
jgi:hypothetical protein